MGGLIQVTSMEPVYDKYGHVMAVITKVKNAGDKIMRCSLTAHVVQVPKRGRIRKSEEHGSSETFELELAPGDERELEMVIHPAITAGREFTISVSVSVEESTA